MGLDPQIADREQALAGKPLIGHPGLGGKGLGQMPVAFATDRRQDRLPFARSQLQQMPDLGACVAPLFPVAHPDAPSDPVIQGWYGPAILRDAKIVHPIVGGASGPEAEARRREVRVEDRREDSMLHVRTVQDPLHEGVVQGRLRGHTPVGDFPGRLRRLYRAAHGSSLCHRVRPFGARPFPVPAPTIMNHHRASSCCADSPRGCRPSMAFVLLGSQLCRRLPSDRPSRDCPCLKLVVVVEYLDGGSPTGDFHPISTCPCRAYTIS